MTNPQVYLKPNVVLEPLYQDWFAWPHLISPATAAMNVRNRHLPIMDSYLQAPAVHERFSTNPTMLGAPFMSHPASRAAEVKQLRDRTVRDYSHMIEFADAIAELRMMLMKEAQGYRLDELYASVPAVLQGYVELSYALDNHPCFRFFEPLLYRSRYYDESAQSLVLHVVEQDGRPFVLSTPRLPDAGALHLHIPFGSAAVDELFRTRTHSTGLRDIQEMLDVGNGQESVFRNLFTEEAPQRPDRRPQGSVQVRYFGHACILVESDGVALLTDPAITSSDGTKVPRYTYADLPERVDCVLITHNHQDHVLLDTLLQLRHRTDRIVVPRSSGGTLEDPSLKLMLEATGFRNVQQLEEMESLTVGGTTVTGIPFLGEHADLTIRSKLGYHLRLSNGYTVMLVADSCNIEPHLYRHVHEFLGDVDMLFLGMECDGAPLSWLYGPLLPQKLPRAMDHSRRLAGSDYGRGIELVKEFHPSEVYVYAMGQEPWLRHIMALEYTGESRPIVASNQLIGDCRSRGIVAERLFGREILACRA